MLDRAVDILSLELLDIFFSNVFGPLKVDFPGVRCIGIGFSAFSKEPTPCSFTLGTEGVSARMEASRRIMDEGNADRLTFFVNAGGGIGLRAGCSSLLVFPSVG